MAETYKTYKFCRQCNGTGVWLNVVTGSTVCPKCLGVGYYQVGWVDGDTELAAISTKVDALQTDMTKALRRLKKILDHFSIEDN